MTIVSDRIVRGRIVEVPNDFKVDLGSSFSDLHHTTSIKDCINNLPVEGYATLEVVTNQPVFIITKRI